MALQKTHVNLAVAVTLTAGAGTQTLPTTAASRDIQVGLTTVLSVKLANGATGPTIAADVQVELSEDDATWYNFGDLLVGSGVNNAVASFGGIVLPDASQFIRLTAGNNTGQNVTLDAVISYIEDV